MENMDAIMERIRKLQAKAEGAKEIGSMHEAEAFAAGVQKMLLKYELDMEDVRASGTSTKEEDIDIQAIMWSEYGEKSTSRRTAWVELLVRGITRPLNCSFYVYPGSNMISVVGKNPSRSIAVFLIGKLVQAANTLANDAYALEWKKNAILGDVTRTRGYRAAWLAGFAKHIGVRMAHEYAQAESAHPGLALVRRRDVELVKEWMDKKGSKSIKTPPVKVKNNSGLVDGIKAAAAQNLHQTGVSTNGESKNVGAGQKLIGSGS